MSVPCLLYVGWLEERDETSGSEALDQPNLDKHFPLFHLSLRLCALYHCAHRARSYIFIPLSTSFDDVDSPRTPKNLLFLLPLIFSSDGFATLSLLLFPSPLLGLLRELCPSSAKAPLWSNARLARTFRRSVCISSRLLLLAARLPSAPRRPVEPVLPVVVVAVPLPPATLFLLFFVRRAIAFPTLSTLASRRDFPLRLCSLVPRGAAWR